MSHVVGIGTDIASIKRFREAAHVERVASFYLRPEEWAELKRAPDVSSALAARFAAKEAVLKAAPERIELLDFSVTKTGEKPSVTWHGKPLPYSFLLSISHETEYACAVALCVSA